jgi:hypothetical protein
MLPWAPNIGMAALVHTIMFALAGWLFLMKWRAPKIADRDTLLMVFPYIYLVAHAYLYIAKFDLFFTVTPDGLIEGLGAGNLISVMFAFVLSGAIIFLTHPPSTNRA